MQAIRLVAMLQQFERTEPMNDKIDELETRVDTAIKAAFRDGPEWTEVRVAVEALKSDRRRMMSMPTEDAFGKFTEAVAKEAEVAAKVIGQETEKVSARVKVLATDLRSAFDKLIHKDNQ